MQQEQSNKKGIIIFTVIVLLFSVVSIFAYNITGDKGIEERFSNALGLQNESQSYENKIFAFTLEGNKLSYGIIFVLILAATTLIYLKYRV